ncbi:MAG: hypothetical protein KIS92_14505 [Planctomycetota bacterium]|nr:hypothetical protein [Planctomycetota bacterium]
MRTSAILALVLAVPVCANASAQGNAAQERSALDLEHAPDTAETVDLRHFRGDTGTLFAKLARFRNLTSLDLSMVLLNDDDLADALAQGQFPPKLETLTLRGRAGGGKNGVTIKGLKRLSACRNLRHLHADFLALKDDDLKELKNLSQLESLSLDGAKIAGQGLRQLRKLKRLAELSLNQCAHLDARYLRDLCELPNLKRLSLLGTRVVDDASLALLAQLPGLESLRLPDLPQELDHVTEAGWKALDALPRLKELSLTACSKLTDESLGHLLGTHPDLEMLCVAGTPLVTDAGFAALGSLKKLQSLSLNAVPKIGNATVARITSLAELLELELRGTGADAAGLEGLAKLTRLVSLESDLPAGDALLKEAGALTALQWLVLPRMQASDEGVAALARLADLETLFLKGERITDRSVAVLSACKKLRKLALKDTNITGRGLDDLGKALPHCVIVMDQHLPQATH